MGRHKADGSNEEKGKGQRDLHGSTLTKIWVNLDAPGKKELEGVTRGRALGGNGITGDHLGEAGKEIGPGGGENPLFLWRVKRNLRWVKKGFH